MKSSVLLVLIGFVGLVAVSQAEDYCSKDLCGSFKHIACNNSGNFAKTCPSDRKMVDIGSIKMDIEKKHNQLRNKLAMGKLPGFQPSARMATIRWDESLAKLAALNVKTCKMEHDKCHNTAKYPQSGQNLAILFSTEKFTNSIKPTALELIDSWWSEYKKTTMKQINSYPKFIQIPIGHFTVMARESNNRFGCAASTYHGEMNKFLMACNYATTNIIDEKIYTSGKTASKCKAGINPNFQGLCSEKEQY